MSKNELELKLVYFDLSGRAEVIRSVLQVAGKKYEDIRMQPGEWDSWKGKAPFGQVPMMSINGKFFGQAVSLAFFLAKSFKLNGKNDLEELQVQSIAITCYDILQLYNPVFRAMLLKEFDRHVEKAEIAAFKYGSIWKEDFERVKEKIMNKLVDEIVHMFADPDNSKLESIYMNKEAARTVQKEALPTFFENFERILKQNGTGYFVGNDITLADLCVLDMFTGYMKRFIGHPQKNKYPLLAKFVDTLSEDTRLRDYIKNRKL